MVPKLGVVFLAAGCVAAQSPQQPFGFPDVFSFPGFGGSWFPDFAQGLPQSGDLTTTTEHMEGAGWSEDRRTAQGSFGGGGWFSESVSYTWSGSGVSYQGSSNSLHFSGAATGETYPVQPLIERVLPPQTTGSSVEAEVARDEQARDEQAAEPAACMARGERNCKKGDCCDGLFCYDDDNGPLCFPKQQQPRTAAAESAGLPPVQPRRPHELVPWLTEEGEEQLDATCLEQGYSCARCMRPCCCEGLVCDRSGPPKCEPPAAADSLSSGGEMASNAVRATEQQEKEKEEETRMPAVHAEGEEEAPEADPCHGVHTDQASCDADKSCTWCKCSALPSACWTLGDAKKLPPAVYECDAPSQPKSFLDELRAIPSKVEALPGDLRSLWNTVHKGTK